MDNDADDDAGFETEFDAVVHGEFVADDDAGFEARIEAVDVHGKTRTLIVYYCQSQEEIEGRVNLSELVWEIDRYAVI